MMVVIQTDVGTWPALAVNVSTGGMFVSGAPFSYGQFIDIVAELPGVSGRIKMPAIVRWIHARGAGVQFLPLGGDVKQALGQIVARSSPHNDN